MKPIKYNKVFLKATTWVVIGAFLFNIVFIDLSWANHGDLLRRTSPVETRTSVAEIKNAFGIRKDEVQTAFAIPQPAPTGAIPYIRTSPLNEETVEDLVIRLFAEETPSDQIQQIQAKLIQIKQRQLELFYLGLSRLGIETLSSIPSTKYPCIDPVDILIAKNYAFMKRDSRKEIYVPQLDRNITLFRNVFNPILTNVTPFLLDNLEVHEGDRVLDLGCGAGVVCLFSALHKARYVLSTDINPDAIACATYNAKRLRLNHVIETRESNLFANISQEEKFDLICYNPPLVEGDAKNWLQLAINDPDFRLHTRFMNEAGDYLSEQGRIVVVCSDKRGSSSRSGVECLLELAKLRFDAKLLANITRHGETYFVYEFTPIAQTKTSPLTQEAIEELPTPRPPMEMMKQFEHDIRTSPSEVWDKA